MAEDINSNRVSDNDGVEDYDTLSVQNDEDGAFSEEYPNIAIKIDRDHYSIFETNRKYKNNKISLDPAFQRNFVWTRRQMSELIESIIMGIPLPLIYMAENRDGTIVVVDGRQRLTTFFKFLDNRFRLEKLKILTEINGLDFKSLEERFPKYASTVEDYQLIIQIIKYPTPDRIRFDIFDRVNRGGTPLNKQEMRNALYQGKATELLNTIAGSEGFLKATGNGISSKRMKDKYIVLRAIAFTMLLEGILADSSGKSVVYKSDIDDLMGKTMDALNHFEDDKIRQIASQFDEVMFDIYNLLGDDAFRLQGDHENRRPISMTLFETMYYLFFKLSDISYDKAVLKSAVSKLLSDKEYLDSLQKSVDSAKSVSVRFEKVIDIYEGITD